MPIAATCLRPLLAILLLFPLPAQQSPTPSLHAAFDRILAAWVRDGMVDYAGLAARDGKALEGYLDLIATVEVGSLDRPAQFALYANLYNATMVQAVLEHTAKNPKWRPDVSDFAVFKEKRVRLKTGTVSLDHLENEIMRPQWKDARVHVAIVCGARSCPPLLPRAYEAADLDAMLAANLRAFLRDPTRNTIDGKKLELSKLFEWFAADFGGEKGIRELLAAEFGPAIASAKIGYRDYSWELNAMPVAGTR